MRACVFVCVDVQTKSDHDVAANRTQDNLDKQRRHIEESVKKMTKAASGKGGDQKKSGQARELAVCTFPPLVLCLLCFSLTRRESCRPILPPLCIGLYFHIYLSTNVRGITPARE